MYVCVTGKVQCDNTITCKLFIEFVTNSSKVAPKYHQGAERATLNISSWPPYLKIVDPPPRYRTQNMKVIVTYSDLLIMSISNINNSALAQCAAVMIQSLLTSTPPQ